MDYEKKYNEALELARDYYKANLKLDKADENLILEDIFPELAESEGDRIRKEILEVAETVVSCDGTLYGKKYNCREWIAWLEKQGESKSAGKMQVSEKLYEHIRNTCACIDDALSSETLADVKDYLSQANYDAQSAFDMIEKQGEQKYIPKYKIGDYVKNTNYKGEPIYEIVYMDKECYICEYRGKERMGDKVVMHFAFDNPYLRLVQKPAELAKGEDYGIDGLYAAVDILQKTLGNVEGYQTDDGILEHECAISAVKELSKQKPAWSEEDECYMSECIGAIATKDGWSFEEKRKTKHWLESLKDRVQPRRRHTIFDEII